LDDREWLRELVKITVNELPEPKLKKSKDKKQNSQTKQINKKTTSR
jgi:hypothetical protein